MIHKEGRRIVIGSALTTILLLGLLYRWLGFTVSFGVVSILLIGLLLFIVSFFRNPKRTILDPDDQLVYAPCDGKVVAIEEVHEPEYFNDKRIQVSIFMSPLNVHVNRNPIGGVVKYAQYHPGKYLVAWHPKSSTENERTTIVYSNGQTEVLMRQIAGALARRIIYYLKPNDHVQQGTDMGFIRFGSRVDLFLPLDAHITIPLNAKVSGNQSIIARLKS